MPASPCQTFVGLMDFSAFFLVLLSNQVGGDGLFRCYFMLRVGSSSHVKDFGVAMVHLDWTFDVELRQRDEMTCKMGTAIMWTPSE